MAKRKRTCKAYKMTRAGRRCASYGSYRDMRSASTVLDAFIRQVDREANAHGGLVRFVGDALSEWIDSMRSGASDEEVVDFIATDLETLEAFAEGWAKDLQKLRREG